jgi:hypothetical protein
VRRGDDAVGAVVGAAACGAFEGVLDLGAFAGAFEGDGEVVVAGGDVAGERELVGGLGVALELVAVDGVDGGDAYGWLGADFNADEVAGGEVGKLGG